MAGPCRLSSAARPRVIGHDMPNTVTHIHRHSPMLVRMEGYCVGVVHRSGIACHNEAREREARRFIGGACP